MAIRVYIKTYNYHELNTNYHKLILFSYLLNKPDVSHFDIFTG